MLHKHGYQFSFSGLKTAVRYSIAPPGVKDFSDINLSEQAKADICASFQAAVVEVLVAKSVRAVAEYKTGHLIVGGGVAANPVLRQELGLAAERKGFDLVIAPMNLCTDNAVMGAIALEKMKRGNYADLDLDITAGLQRGF
jgi:N6-L-threonylcarbamoyladenine synthase